MGSIEYVLQDVETAEELHAELRSHAEQRGKTLENLVKEVSPMIRERCFSWDSRGVRKNGCKQLLPKLLNIYPLRWLEPPTSGDRHDHLSAGLDYVMHPWMLAVRQWLETESWDAVQAMACQLQDRVERVGPFFRTPEASQGGSPRGGLTRRPTTPTDAEELMLNHYIAALAERPELPELSGELRLRYLLAVIWAGDLERLRRALDHYAPDWRGLQSLYERSKEPFAAYIDSDQVNYLHGSRSIDKEIICHFYEMAYCRSRLARGYIKHLVYRALDAQAQAQD